MRTTEQTAQPRSGIAIRALFFYLVLVWLLVRQAGVVAPGTDDTLWWALSLLAGFPLSVYLAYRWSSPGANGLGRIGRPFAAAAVAMLLPLCALSLSDKLTDGTRVWIDDHDLVPASLIPSLETADRPDGLRLRIRGLTLSPPPATHGSQNMPAELLIDTSLQDDGSSTDLLVRARLMDATDGSVHWSTEYTVDPEDTSAIRRVLLKALSEGMSRTCEGSFPSEGQLI